MLRAPDGAKSVDDERARRAIEGGPRIDGWHEFAPTLPTMDNWADPSTGLDLADGPLVFSFDDDGEYE